MRCKVCRKKFDNNADINDHLKKSSNCGKKHAAKFGKSSQVDDSDEDFCDTLVSKKGKFDKPEQKEKVNDTKDQSTNLDTQAPQEPKMTNCEYCGDEVQASKIVLNITRSKKCKAKCGEYLEVLKLKKAQEKKTYDKAYQKKNAEKIKERKRHYNAEHAEEQKAKRRKYNSENPEKVKENRKEYRNKRSDVINEKQKDYDRKNCETIRANQKEYKV